MSTLRTREGVDWLADRVVVHAQQGAFLLHPKIRLVVPYHAHDLRARVSQVCLCGSQSKSISQAEIPSPPQLEYLLTCSLVLASEHLAEHQLVGVVPERVSEQGYWDQEHLAVETL